MRVLALAAVAFLTGCSENALEYTSFTDTREEVVEQHFEVKHARSDLLFYADTSFSMQRELVLLADTIDKFIGRVDDSADDWQLMAVTGPDGCANGGVLNPLTPNWQEKFAEGIQKAPGRDDVDEWGLFNVFNAVLKSAPGQCNEGFIRGNSLLHIIIISDEDDNSPGFDQGGKYWKDYVDPILFMKDKGQVRFSAITGPVPSGCATADPGYGYVDAVDATDGEFLSICDDWIGKVDLIADASIIKAFFKLEHEPLEKTLTVWHNGEKRTGGFEYVEEKQGILFTEDLPVAWDTVDVKYNAIVEYEVREEAE